MKFKIRDGFVCKIATRVSVGEGKFDLQESSSFAGAVVDFNDDQAREHAHKLQPADDAADAFMESLALPVPSETVPTIPNAQIEVLAKQLALLLQAATQAPAAVASAK